MNGVLDAIEAFFDRLTEVDFRFVALAICCHLLKGMCTSRAWRNTLAAAYPDEEVPWPRIYAAYLAGIGVNALMPFRGGDVVKLGLAHRAIPGATYVTLASSLLVLAIVDSVVALAFFAYALTQHVLPSFASLPDLPSFDYHLPLEHPRVSAVIVVTLLVLLVLGAVKAKRELDEFKARVRQGVIVLTDRWRYLRTVALWQLGDWTLRLLTVACFLAAFGIDVTVRNVLLVQVTQSLATLVPVSPAGIGTEQAFIVYVFRGTVAGSKLLAFSVGMKLTLVATNVVVGFTALALTLRTLNVGSFLRRRRNEEAPAES